MGRGEIMFEFYTSYYEKIKDYPKGENDVFIQVSRTCPLWFVKDGESLIDISYEDELGNFSKSLDDYWTQLESEHEILAEIAEDIKADIENFKNDPEIDRVFFLCHEDIEKKPCHRRIIAKYIKEKFDVDIPEWQG
jgi:hypothetical protein